MSADGEVTGGGDGNSRIEYRNGAGKWEKIQAEPVVTGDPDLDYLWDIEIGELNDILDDPEHPLHTKAQLVGAEIMAPLYEAANSSLKPVMDRLREQISKATRVVTSAPALPTPEQDAILQPAEGRVDVISDASGDVDVKGVTAESSATEVRDVIVAAAAAALERTATATEATLDHSRDVESARKAEHQEQTARARRTEVAGWIAAGGAIGAVLVGIATIIVTIAVSR